MPPADTPPTNTTPPPAAASDAIDPKDDALLNILFSSVADDEGQKKEASEDAPPEPSRTLFEAIEDKTPIKKPKEDKKEEKDKKPATDEKKETATPPPAAAPVTEEKPIRRRRTQAPPSPTPPPAAPPAAKPHAEQDDSAWEKDLIEEEREQLESARFAERKFPEKYKGFGDRVAKFLKEHKAKVEAEGFDASDPAYQSWLQKNKPALSQQEVLRIERERTKEETLRDADAKLADVRDESWRLTHEPELRKQADEFYRQAAKDALPKDLLEAISDKSRGLEWARENMALETEIAEAELKEAADNVETYIRLTTRNPSTNRAFTAYNPEDPAHKGAMTMLKEVCEEYKRAVAGRPEAIREGRSYVTRLEWAAMTPEQQRRHWTLSDKEVISVYRARVKYSIGAKIEAEKSRYKRYFKAGGSSQSQASTPPPAKQDDSPPPAPRPSAVPQGGGSEASEVDTFVNDALFGRPVN